MTKKKSIAVNVLVEAKNRLHRIFDEYDSVVVAFSGGKDSTALLWLTREVQLERGLTQPVNAQFKDYEFFGQSILDFVRQVGDFNWVNLLWFAVQRYTKLPSLGKFSDVVVWDDRRQWMRPRPPGAIVGEPGRIYTVAEMDELLAAMFPGRVAILLGIRADESLYRYRSVVGRLEDGWINPSSTSKADLVKPIYDWRENDVLKYVHDSQIPLSDAYRERLLLDLELRTSSAIHPGAAKHLERMKLVDPELYEWLCTQFPHLRLHALYWNEIDESKVIARYGRSYGRVREWIEMTMVDPVVRERALKNFDRTITHATSNPHLYTPEYILRSFLHGTFGRAQLVPSAPRPG